jgi:hypothetical protein
LTPFDSNQALIAKTISITIKGTETNNVLSQPNSGNPSNILAIKRIYPINITLTKQKHKTGWSLSMEYILDWMLQYPLIKGFFLSFTYDLNMKYPLATFGILFSSYWILGRGSTFFIYTHPFDWVGIFLPT